VYFIFDLLHLDGDDVAARRLIERKARLAELLSDAAPPLHYSDYHRGRGPTFHEQACKLELEGIVSKRADAPYAPGNRGLWVKVKCLHREEFVVVGWTDPEGSRPWLGALLVAYYDPDGRLVYAGRAGTGMKRAELERLWRRLQPLATDTMPLDIPPPRTSRFGSPLVLSRVHWVRPELVAEVKFLHAIIAFCHEQRYLRGGLQEETRSMRAWRSPPAVTMRPRLPLPALSSPSPGTTMKPRSPH
jgi:bifunctional non-homologous end joining protein LigD